jgi:hypothetical protein
MRPRGCLLSIGVLALLALLCCVVGWFVGLPRIQDSIADGISESLSTQVAEQIARSGVPQGEAGTYTISMTDLEREMQAAGNTDNVDDITFSAENGTLELTFGSQGQSFDYSGVPVAQDGRFELTDVSTTGGGFIDRLFPADKLAGAVEGGINRYFDAQGLQVVNVTAENDELVIETEPTGR